MGTVAVAFDNDPAGEEAMQNALLTVLQVEPDVADFLRSWVLKKDSYDKAIGYLSNSELADQYRFNLGMADNRNLPDWLRDGAREDAAKCMVLINKRASQVNRQDDGTNRFKEFNSQNTITSVLSKFGYRSVPGRTTYCPVHDDSTPSLSVAASDTRAYCFNQSCVLWHDGHGVDAYELNKILSNRT